MTPPYKMVLTKTILYRSIYTFFNLQKRFSTTLFHFVKN